MTLYRQGRQEAVLPRLVSPRMVAGLWFLLGLIGTAGLVAWFTRLPIYVSGTAVVIDRNRHTALKQDEPKPDELLLVAFFPPETHSNLHAEQSIWLQPGPTEQQHPHPIITTVPSVMSPMAAQKRFSLGPGAAQVIAQPSAVAIATFEPSSLQLPSKAYLDSVYTVQVEVSSRPAITFLPFFSEVIRSNEAFSQGLGE